MSFIDLFHSKLIEKPSKHTYRIVRHGSILYCYYTAIYYSANFDRAVYLRQNCISTRLDMLFSLSRMSPGIVSPHVIIYTIIRHKSVDVRKLQVTILARSPRKMYQTDRILPRYIPSRVRVSVRPRIFSTRKNRKPQSPGFRRLAMAGVVPCSMEQKYRH